MKILNELKKSIDANQNIENVLNAFGKLCSLKIKNAYDEGLSFCTNIEYKNGQYVLYFGLARQ